jgi:hypothetical protein
MFASPRTIPLFPRAESPLNIVSGRASWLDPVMAISVAAATLIISTYFAPRGYQAGFVDMAHDGYQLRQARDLSEGGVIFRDTFDQYGAFNGYLNTVGFVLLGHRLLAMKYFICGWYALIAVALFVVARHWLNPLLAGFSVMVWLGLAPFYQHGIMISPHVYVLFFQALATIVALRASSLEPRRFALVGVLTGLSWSMKQSMGVLFLAGILMYLGCRLVVARRDGWRGAAAAAIAVTIGFFGVVGAVLLFLWTRGALGDWYRQTIVFPREFYLLEYGQRLQVPVVAEFVRMQTAQAPYWLLIRAVVFLAALVQFRTRRDDGLLLVASITAFLWLGAFPSANFMHQWWTVSLAFPAFVWVVTKVPSRITTHEGLVTACTILLVLVTVGAGLLDRKRATTFRASSLSQTIVDPPVFRGIRTDPPMKRAFETLYGVMSHYQVHHPGTKIVAIDAADGFWSGINESLPFLSALDGNTHPQPVYWNLPVLSTTTYPRYGEVLWNEVRAERPLLIEHREGAYKPLNVSAYALLAAVQSDFGYWYVYAADHPGRAQHGEVSTFLARDGATEEGFAETGAAPTIDAGLNPNAVGAPRGTVPRAAGPVSLYTWPADLPLRKLDGEVEPVSAPVSRADIARQLGAGEWIVDGPAKGRFDGLLEFPEREIAAGSSLIVRGELYEGGFQVGFVARDEWSGFVTVTQEGPFEAVLEIQRSGRYRLTLANCIESSPWQTARRHWLRGSLGLVTGGFMPNRFRISQFGWVRD